MFGKKKINPYEEDLKRLMECMRNTISGDNSLVDVSNFHDPELAKTYNELLCNILDSNTIFVMRMNDAMKQIGDFSVVKNMIEEVSSQVKTVDTIHVSGEELEKSISKVQESVRSIQKSSAELMRTTNECTDDIQTSLSTIEESTQEVTGINDKLGDFRESAANITKVIDQIRSLASSSSMLALNASIEAARAGEMGRGFAVVAQQMGELSENTNSCALSVGKYIQELLGDLDQLANSVQEATMHIQQGTERVNKSVLNLDAMKVETGEIDEDINAIFEEINTQSSLTKEFIALGNSVANGFERLNQDCFLAGEQFYKVSRRVDLVRSDLARGRSALKPLDWITVFEVDHLIFTWRQYNNLVGYEHLKLEQVNNPGGCKLGKWFAAQTDEKITGSVAFKQTFDCHNELHKHAVDCFNAVARGERDKAMEHFNMAFRTYGQLVKALDELRKVMLKAGYSEATDFARKK